MADILNFKKKNATGFQEKKKFFPQGYKIGLLLSVTQQQDTKGTAYILRDQAVSDSTILYQVISESHRNNSNYIWTLKIPPSLKIFIKIQKINENKTFEVEVHSRSPEGECENQLNRGNMSEQLL